jgi:putative NAD(P)H nitroreductase
MEVWDALKNRRAIHHFLPGIKIPRSDFLKMVEAASYTPSGYNAQPWEFLLLKQPESIQKISEIAFGQKQILEAGNIVIVLGDRDFGVRNTDEILSEWKQYRNLTPEKYHGLKTSLTKERTESKKREMTLRNASMAAMSFLLVAEEMGYQTCPMMGFSQIKLRKFLSLPEPIFPILMIAIGHADPKHPEPPQLPRKTPKKIAHFEKYTPS